MIVRSLNDIENTSRVVTGPGWTSHRLLLASDGMGYSFHDTIIKEGTELTLEYKHHFEACYCIEGEGEVSALSDGKVHAIKLYTIYALDKNDRHTIIATKGDLRLVCAFSPALTGQEVHREDGSYAPSEINK